MERRTPGVALPTILGFFTAAVIGLALGNASVAWFKTSPESGVWHVHLWDASMVVLPLSVLTFALGASLVARGRWVAGALALPALPAWCAMFLMRDSVLANDGWIGLVAL